MKPFILTCFFAFIQMAVYSQNQLVNPNDLHVIGARTFNKTCAAERISAAAFHLVADTATRLGDSVQYYYSGTNGSVYNFYDLSFTGTMPALATDFIYGPLVHCDSQDFYRFGVTSTSEEHTGFDYTAVGQLERATGTGTYWSGTTLTQFNQQLPTVTSMTEIYNIPSDTISSTWYYSFNAQQQLIEDSIVSGNGYYGVCSFGYYPNGNISSFSQHLYQAGSPYLLDSTSYEYDVAGRPARSLRSVLENGVWIVKDIDSLLYSGTNPMYNAYIRTSFDSATASYLAYQKEFRTYNSNGLPDSVMTYILYYGNWIFRYGSAIVYNSNNNPLRKTDFGYYYPGSVMDTFAVTNYYYEPISPAGMPTVFSTSSLMIYPNPAQGFINIKLPAATSKTCRARLSDMSGKCLREWSLSTSDNHCALGALASGVYTLVVYDGDAAVHRQQVVVR